MDIEQILTLNDTDKIIETIKTINKFDYSPSELQDIYDGLHEILDRPDKPKKDKNGNIIGTTQTAKLVLNYQKKIVESAVAFIFGVPVSLSKSSEGGDDSFRILKSILKNLKWDNSNRAVSRTLFTQRRVAKLFYLKNPENKESRKISYLLLDYKNGEFYPNFDSRGDMDAFLRTYEKIEIIESKTTKIKIFELYTSEQIQIGRKIEGGKWVIESTNNPFGKIPVVYYEQDKEEWGDSKTLISNQEKSLSQLADTNEYFAAPIIKLFGNVSGAPNKEEQGKALTCTPVSDGKGGMQKSDAEYLTWDQRPESLEMQFKLIENYIYSFTQTPDISFGKLLENKPGNISGVALKILLLDPIMKSLNKQEIFETGIQRELSVIKSIASVIDVGLAKDFEEMQIDVGFNSILPDNLIEVIDYLTQATGGKAVMSQETAIKNNPLVSDSQSEIEKIREDDGIEAGSLDI